ncbi:hydantoin racemase [Sporolactobacillus sp. THM7-7]|nr:hydantoin racemase [Sporolactobacillus sp. THM7-7]
MIGVIRVFTSDDPEVVQKHGAIIENIYHLRTISKCIPDQPFGIHNDETEERAIPKIIEVGKELEKEGCEAVVVSCAADPGVAQLQQTLSIPVIGAGSAAAYLALESGVKTGVIGITNEVPPVIGQALGQRLVKYIRPEGVRTTKDLTAPEGKRKSIEAAKHLIESGAKQIVFACTGLSTIGLAKVLREELNVPVIDAVEAEGFLASAIEEKI